MTKFQYLRDPLFLVAVALYGLNRFAEHCFGGFWISRAYLKMEEGLRWSRMPLRRIRSSRCD